MLQLDDRRFSRLALGAVIVGLTLLVASFAAGLLALDYSQRSKERVNHTYQVTEALMRVQLFVERAETASRGYLLSPDADRAQIYRYNVELLGPSVARLGTLTLDNPVQRRAVSILRARVDAQTAVLGRIMTLALTGRIEPARALFVEEVKLRRINAIRDLTEAMSAEETRLMARRAATENKAATMSKLVLGVTGALLLLVAIGTVWLVRRYTVDLALARNRLNLLNVGLESAVAERTSDLSRANDEIQRFAYIVSHDLRAPLVNVMGFTAELDTANGLLRGLVDRVATEAPTLLTEEARRAAHEDLPEAIGFIRSSSQKMDRLINAILKLSREGRRTLTPEQLPMVHLVGTIRDSLKHRLHESKSEIRIDAALPDVVSDRLAIEQLFSNLIENAVKYLRPGVPGRIVVRGEQRGGRLWYEIEDNGRGIDPRDHERIFDLFRRAGAQDQPGEGIGLAHARGLAYRLGGTIDVRSVAGSGSTFQLNLPVTFGDQGTPA